MKVVTVVTVVMVVTVVTVVTVVIVVAVVIEVPVVTVVKNKFCHYFLGPFNCDKIQKIKFGRRRKNQIVTKLKNSNCEKTQKLNL